jgi:hypothetical protein
MPLSIEEQYIIAYHRVLDLLEKLILYWWLYTGDFGRVRQFLACLLPGDSH